MLCSKLATVVHVVIPACAMWHGSGAVLGFSVKVVLPRLRVVHKGACIAQCMEFWAADGIAVSRGVANLQFAEAIPMKLENCPTASGMLSDGVLPPCNEHSHFKL